MTSDVHLTPPPPPASGPRSKTGLSTAGEVSLMFGSAIARFLPLISALTNGSSKGGL
jgi:hypothetical protein